MTSELALAVIRGEMQGFPYCFIFLAFLKKGRPRPRDSRFRASSVVTGCLKRMRNKCNQLAAVYSPCGHSLHKNIYLTRLLILPGRTQFLIIRYYLHDT